jgi:ADP-ribosyl-[dinitrogen reductase] hydrolase
MNPDQPAGTIAITNLTPGARLLLGMAIGDAFGATFENQNRGDIILPDNWPAYGKGNRYTDDTQMAIGIAELLVSAKPFTEENVADALLTAYKRDPRRGYSKLTGKMLQESETAESFLKSIPENEIRERKSDGAAMRALPLGVIPDKDEMIRSAILSARITHGHPDALAATVGIALIAHERYYNRRPFEAIIPELPNQISFLTPEGRAYLVRIFSEKWNPDDILKEHASYGVPYTEALILLGAVSSILAHFGEDPWQALCESILIGGDTDTTAAIVLGAALIHPGVYTLPDPLITDLENGPYGRNFLLILGDKLDRMFPVRGA